MNGFAVGKALVLRWAAPPDGERKVTETAARRGSESWRTLIPPAGGSGPARTAGVRVEACGPIECEAPAAVI